jgi:hypothetical protein
MITLQTKQTEPIDLYNGLKKCVEETSGPQIVGELEGSLRTLQQCRNDLMQVAAVRNDVVALEKLAVSGKLYYSMWSTVSQSFTFGKEKVCSFSAHILFREAWI